MSPRVKEVLCALQYKGPPASSESLAKLQTALGVTLPDEYLELLQIADGCEGFVNADSYVVVCSIECALIRNEKENLIPRDFPGVIVFASDGGDVAYCYDMRRDDKPIVVTSFSDPSEFSPKVVARNMEEWIDYLLGDERIY